MAFLSQAQINDVTKLAVTMFGAAPGQFKTYMQDVYADNNSDMLATANAYATFPVYSYLWPATNTTEDNAAQLMDAFGVDINATNPAGEPIGQWAYDSFLEGLEAGESVTQMIVWTIDLLAAPDNVNYAEQEALLNTKVAVANNFSNNEGANETNLGALQYVINQVTGDETVAEHYDLTLNQDIFNPDGGSAQKIFTADIINGQNTLQSGDEINGGLSDMDTLKAELVPEGAESGGNIDTQPTTKSVEIVEIEARDANAAAGLTVTLDAKNMADINKIGSKFSDGDLIIENLTTLTSAGTARNTDNITVTMDHTDNMNSDGDASDLTVYFDEDYLLNNESVSEGEAYFWVLDQDADMAGLPLLTDNVYNGLSFYLGDGATQSGPYEISSQAAYEADNHVDYVNALNDRLTEMKAAGEVPQSVTLFLDPTNTKTTYLDNGSLSTPVPAIVVDSGDGSKVTPGDWTTPTGKLPPDNNVWTRVDDKYDTEQLPLQIDVELHKVGREGEGGNLTIGGKELGNAEGNGINQFNIDVLGGDDKPSNLGQIISTNGALTTINVESTQPGTDKDGNATYASLTVRGENNEGADASPFGGTLDTFNAADFKGDLTIGNEGAAQNINTFTATGGGDVDLTANINANGEFVYTTGTGEDDIDITLDTGAMDTVNDSFSLSTGGANDTVMFNGTGVASQETMEALDNMSVNLGSGDDEMTIVNEVRLDIDAGADNDFVVFDGGSAGQWTVGDASLSNTANTWVDRTLFNAEVTVTFAGFESTFTIPTKASGNYIADQEMINAAIISAIEAHPDLDRLLETTLGTGKQLLTINATVDGLNDLAIDVNQPTLVASTATAAAGEVNAPTGSNLTALVQGMINTTTLTSAGLVDAGTGQPNETNVIAAFNNDATANLGDGRLNQNGDADAAYVANQFKAFNNGEDGIIGTNGGVANASVIDMGRGTEDLLVLDSNLNSENILEINGVFDHVSVVNFFDISPNDVTARAEVGLNALDFTSILNNTMDPSVDNSNTQSVVSIPVTLNTNGQLAGSPASTGDAYANSVNMLNYNNTGSTISFDDLTAAQLVTALNGDAAAGVVTGGLGDADLNPAFTTNIVETTQKHIIMVENDQNKGEYKVFLVTSTVNLTAGTASADFNTTGAELLGTMDFGQSINFKLVGSQLIDLGGGDFRTAEYTELDPANTTWTAYRDSVLANIDTTNAGSTADFSLADAVTAYNNGALPVSYNIIDSANVLESAWGSQVTVLNGAKNITANTAANIAQANDIAAYSNSGSTTYNVSDSLTNMLLTTTGAMSVLAANKAGLAGATTVTIVDMASEAVVFNNLKADVAATSIDFSDDAATMTDAQFTAIFETAGLDSTAGDVITVNTITDDAIDISGQAAGFIIDAQTNDVVITGLNTGDDFTIGNGGSVTANNVSAFVATAATGNQNGSANPPANTFAVINAADAGSTIDLTLATSSGGYSGYTVNGGDGVDTLVGSAVADTINGGANDDIISGGAGVDTLNGGDGADTLTGGDGNDNLTGGNGVDQFNVDAGTDAVTDFGAGSEVDTITVSAGATANVAVTADYTSTAATDIDNQAANTNAVFTVADGVNFDASASTDTTNGITITAAANNTASTLVGTNKADVITGGAGADTITGGDGNDTITGGDNADNLTGGAGDDVFTYAATTEFGDTINDFNANSESDKVAFDVEAGGLFSAAAASGNVFMLGSTTAITATGVNTAGVDSSPVTVMAIFGNNYGNVTAFINALNSFTAANETNDGGMGITQSLIAFGLGASGTLWQANISAMQIVKNGSNKATISGVLTANVNTVATMTGVNAYTNGDIVLV